MSGKTRKILAYIGLGLMGVFSVAFVMFLIDPRMFNGVIAFIALFTFVGGLACFFLVRIKKQGADGGTDNEKDGDDEAEVIEDTVTDDKSDKDKPV